MQNYDQIDLPENTTPLRVPITLLDVWATDCRTPADFAAELKRQLTTTHCTVAQLHPELGPVVQMTVSTLEQEVRHVWPFLGAQGYAIGLRNELALDCIENVYPIIHRDTLLTLQNPWHPTAFAGVNELANAIEAGTATRRINLAVHTHRRQEIAAVVAEVLARRRYAQQTEFTKVRDAAVETLSRIDELLEKRALIRQAAGVAA